MSAYDGVAAVAARIASLQNRFGVAPPPVSADPTFERVLAGLSSPARPAATARLRASGSHVPPLTGDGTGGERVVAEAARHLGTPYVWGGESPEGGFDCSGLVQYAYRHLGVELPRTSAEQARVGRPVRSLADAKPGDLVAFNTPVDHIGIYAGDDLMVVAPRRGDVVKVQRIYAPPSAIRRILPDGATATW